MSSQALTSGVNLGLSFEADDGSFMCAIQRAAGFTFIGFEKDKDRSCKFFVENLGNGRVTLKDHNMFYLRRTERDGRHQIEAGYMTPSESCEFKLFARNGKAILQADNGLFLSRIDSGLLCGVNTLEAAKEEDDVYCEFLPEAFLKTCSD